MPVNKDFKRVVRTRMQKTGESYTAARANLLKRITVHVPTPPAPKAVALLAPPTVNPDDYAKVAGMSDAALKAKTGCAWAAWVKALDQAKAYEWSHRDIATYAREKFKTPGWWTQTIAVGYERIKGLRERTQMRDGAYRANKSRTFAVPLKRLYAAFGNPKVRARWLGTDFTIRTATREKYMRIAWPDRTSVLLTFTSKGRSKAQVQAEHGGLTSKDQVARVKEYWGERFDALGAALT
jgi:hypothetical protein